MTTRDPGHQADVDGRFIGRAMAAPLLSREREAELAKRWRDAQDQAAYQELVTSHSRLVISLANKYRGYGLPLADMIQEGHIGLLQAVSKFDPDRGFRLATYAMWWVKAALTDYVLRNWSIVRLGSAAREKALFFKLRSLKAKVAQAQASFDGVSGSEAVAELLGVERASVERMEMTLAFGDQSLNEPLGEDSDSDRMALLADERPSPELAVQHRHDRRVRTRWLAAALGDLPQREAAIIRSRHLCEHPVTLDDLGRQFGVSKERIRQLETRAIAVLKRTLGAREALDTV